MNQQQGFLTPRSIMIVVILLVMLIVPLWWLKGSEKRQAAEVAREKAIDTAPSHAAAPAPTPAAVNNPDAHGMSWGIMPPTNCPARACG
ncbi:MAG: hypothetical protein HC765_14250 [Brachymonas sp.]|nr:hypothetical protein [Brachymonas sp.]